MRKFGVLGALVFALLVAAGPVAADAHLVFTMTGGPGYFAGRFHSDAHQFSLGASWGPSCILSYRVGHRPWVRLVNDDAEHIRLDARLVTLPLGRHYFHIKTDCAQWIAGFEID